MIRVSKFFTETEIRLFYGFIFTMPGVPFLYYGDEIGMRYLALPTKEGGYHRTGSRTPMQWNHEKNLGFSNAASDNLYLPVDESCTNQTVEDALRDDASLYYHVKKLISLRHQYPDLQSNNNFEVYYAEENSKLFAYKRGEFLIVLNPSLTKERLILDADYEVVYSFGAYQCKRNVIEQIEQAFILLKKK